MQKQKNGHTGLLPNVTVIPFFPLEDVWIMVFELSLIRFAIWYGSVFLYSCVTLAADYIHHTVHTFLAFFFCGSFHHHSNQHLCTTFTY